MNKHLFCLAAFLAPLGASFCAQAQPCGIEALFGGRGAESLTFYECTGKGDSARAICRSVNRKKSVTFRRDGTVSGNYFDRKEGFTGTWKQRPDSDDVSVTEGPALGMDFSLVDGKYLVYFSEEGDDIYPYVLDAKPAARPAAGRAPAGERDVPGQAEAFVAGLVHLKATGADVRLRTGPGTSHKVLRKVGTSEGSAPGDDLVASRETASGDGSEWYHVLYVPAWSEAEGYMPTDAWICADFVQASALTPADRQAVLLDRFGIPRSGTPRQAAPDAAPPLWRAAGRTSMTYVGFAGDVVLRRDVAILPSELVTEDVIETFRIIRRDGASFCARNQEDSFYVDGREGLKRLDGWNLDELCGTISGGRLTLKDGTTLRQFDGDLGRTFPPSLLKRPGDS